MGGGGGGGGGRGLGSHLQNASVAVGLAAIEQEPACRPSNMHPEGTWKKQAHRARLQAKPCSKVAPQQMQPLTIAHTVAGIAHLSVKGHCIPGSSLTTYSGYQEAQHRGFARQIQLRGAHPMPFQ